MRWACWPTMTIRSRRGPWKVPTTRSKPCSGRPSATAMRSSSSSKSWLSMRPSTLLSDDPYYFHGRGCCISHKIDGDAIDVDFWDDSAEYFDTFFFKKYLESLRRPQPPEQRLRELHPSARAVTIAINDLIALGALTPLPDHGTHPYYITGDVLASADAIASFCSAWTDPQQRA